MEGFGSWNLTSLPNYSTIYSEEADDYKSYEYRALKTGDGIFGDKNTTGVISLKSGTTGLNRFCIMEITNRTSTTWPTAQGMTAGDTNKWRCPTKDEWPIFAGSLGIGTNYSSTYGLSDVYWSSTENTSSYAWDAYFSYGYMSGDIKTNTNNVRLCTTF